MSAFGDGRALEAGDFSARGTRFALLHSSLSAGTPPRAWPLLPSACFAQPGSTPRMLHRAQTAGCEGARQLHEAALPLPPSAAKPRAPDTMREYVGHAWLTMRAAPMLVDIPARRP